jgi:YD repeat-containing protein
VALSLPFLRQWREDRARAERAERYATVLMAPPPEALVAQLASLTDGDVDHAGWEWRYARRALGLIVAERDAQDDRTASEIVSAFSNRQAVDPDVAPERRAMSLRQFNDRLAAYRGAVANRISADPLSVRLGFVLLRFQPPATPTPQAAATLGLALADVVEELNTQLSAIYGPPVLLEPPK